MTSQELAECLGGWRKVGARYLVHCPAHDDGHQSLELADGEKGVLMVCRAGCDQARVVDLVCTQAGITHADLFYEPQRAQEPRRIVATYDYCDAQGTLLFQAVRYDPKAFRQRRPDGQGGWIWKLDGIEPVLYRLPEVLAAVRAGRVVYIVEGEKDVETLRTMGLVATCSPMGAGKWRTAYNASLRGADVVVLPDHDEPGRKHAQQVAQALHGIAAHIKVVEMPGLSVKGDVSDWIQAGGTRDELEELVAASPTWTPPGQANATPRPARQLRVTSLATVMPERVRWLWKPYVPLGRPMALEGDPGIGKSSLVAKISAHLTSGQAFPNVIPRQAPQPFPACNVCLLTAEDDPGDTILPRIAVNGGDPARVYLIDGWHQPDGTQGPVTMQDLDLLQQALEQHTPSLLVFDPVQSFFGRRVDMNSASDTRPVLDAVIALCKRHDCTPLFVRHIGKARRDKALYAGLGSIDITAAMRAVLFLGQDPDQEPRRILAQSKANNARLGPSLAYRIVSVEHELVTPTGDVITVEAPRLDWDGLSPLTATDLASPPLTTDEETSALDQAREFLGELLAEDPMLADEVAAAAKKACITMATLRRAKGQVGIKTRHRRLEGKPSKEWPWEWYCAEAQPTGSSPSIDSDEHLEHLENITNKSMTYNDSSRCSSAHLETEPQSTENQSLALDALDAHQHTVPSAPAPAFTSFVASEVWCVTCAATVSFRMLTQLDGTELYLCATCDTEVDRKRTTAPPSTNGTRPPDDAPQAGQPASGDEEEDFSDIPF